MCLINCVMSTTESEKVCKTFLKSCALGQYHPNCILIFLLRNVYIDFVTSFEIRPNQTEKNVRCWLFSTLNQNKTNQTLKMFALNSQFTIREGSLINWIPDAFQIPYSAKLSECKQHKRDIHAVVMLFALWLSAQQFWQP